MLPHRQIPVFAEVNRWRASRRQREVLSQEMAQAREAEILGGGNLPCGEELPRLGEDQKIRTDKR